MMGGIMQVFISKDDRQWGPYDAAQMGCLIERGSFSLQDWAWIEGNADWVPLHQVLYTLSNEKKAESQKLHQKVEVAKDLWRSKMTQPTPAVFREERPRNARTTRQVAAAAAGGSALGRNIFCGALGVGLAVFVAMLALSGPKETEVKNLTHENGLMFKVDSSEPFQGKAVMRYPDGQVKNEAQYRDGLRHGEVVSFYPDGTRESEGVMKDGVYHGNVTFFHPNGHVKSQARFYRGSAVSKKNWDEEGSVLSRPE